MGMRIVCVGVLCAVAAGAQVAASNGSLVSRRLPPEAVVDGRWNEWPSLDFVTKQVAVGVANGPDALHIVVATSDPDVRLRLLSAGLIVYLDREGGKKQTFGVRVPALGRSVPQLGPAEPHISYVELIGPAKDQRRMIEQDIPFGIRAAVGNHEGTLVVEFGIPLLGHGDGGVGLALESSRAVIGLGLVTPDPPRNAGARGDGRGSGGGGRGGGGRGGGPPGGGAPPQGPDGVGSGKALKAWTTVALAPTPDRGLERSSGAAKATPYKGVLLNHRRLQLLQ